MHQTPSTAAIILAAGSSSRMGGGRHKLLLPLEDRPVLAHVIDAVLASQARPILIVLGHQANQVRTHLAGYAKHPTITIVENPDYLQGMSTSMRAGLQVLLFDGYRKNIAENGDILLHPRDAIHGVPANSVAFSKIDSALIMLGDQPLITPRIIDTLIDTRRLTGKRIVAPLYAGKRGNPTLFADSLFPELLEVTGDEGGRSVVEHHRQELEMVELGDAMASYDVDTWEAYQQVVEAWKRKSCEKVETRGKGWMEAEKNDVRKKQAAFWLEYSQQLSTAIRYTEALKAAERAVKLDELSVEAWYALGTCQAMLAQYHEALAAFEHALTLGPQYVPAWDGKAWVLGILGHKEEALRAMNRALELDPDYFEALKRKKRLEAMEQ